jgi:hypothetical protein
MTTDHRIKWKVLTWDAFHRRLLTRTDRDVLLALAGYAATGTAWPSHATLAARVGCHPRTVRRALAAGRALGLVDWHEGGRWLSGGVWRRRSNRYRLITPEVLAPRGHYARRERVRDLRKSAEQPRSVAEQLAALGVTVPISGGSPAFQDAMRC